MSNAGAKPLQQNPARPGRCSRSFSIRPISRNARAMRSTSPARCARGGGRLIVLHVVEVVHVASEGYEDALNERLRRLPARRPVDPGRVPAPRGGPGHRDPQRGLGVGM